MIFEALNWVSGYFYGAILVYFFLYNKFTRKNLIAFFLLSCFSIIIQLCVAFLWGFELVNKIYPFIVHVPLFLFYVLYMKRNVSSALSAILVAYILMLPRNWFGELASACFPSFFFAKDLTKFIVSFPLFFLLFKFLVPRMRSITNKRILELQLFIVPGLLYYLISYIVTVYTHLLFNTGIVTVELIIILFSAALLIYIGIIFYQLSKTTDLEQRQKLYNLQSTETSKRMEEIKFSQERVKILRHDLRHYLQMVDNMLTYDKIDEAKQYIHHLNKEIDETIIQQFSENEAINSILSSYNGKAKKSGIKLSINSNMTKDIMISDLDICIVLANGIENAFHAVANVDNPWVSVECNLYNNKIVIQIKNPFNDSPKLTNGIPKTDKEGHGIGTMSIVTIAEKYKGISEFEIDDDHKIFILKVIL